MSRKRAKKQEPEAPPAVPEEILADGSGPHDVVAEVVVEAAVDAEVATVAVMAEDGTLAVSVTEAAVEAEVEAAVEASAADPIDGDAPIEDEVVDAGEDAGELGAALPTSAATMDGKQLKHLVEALVFASDKPVTLLRLRQLTRVADVTRLEAALAELAADFADRGLILQQVSGGYQFRTQTRYSGWVQQLIAGRPVRLSRAQLETLAIIAYRQPITRPEIDEIRGVDSRARSRSCSIARSCASSASAKRSAGRCCTARPRSSWTTSASAICASCRRCASTPSSRPRASA